MIELTEQQRQELKGDLSRVIDPQTKKIYVLVSEEAYERMQALLASERLARPEQQALLHAAGLRAGWDDPEMDLYDREKKDLYSNPSWNSELI
jgi:hypothetical protein